MQEDPAPQLHAECPTPDRVLAILDFDPTASGRPATGQGPTGQDHRCTVRFFVTPDGGVRVFRKIDEMPSDGLIYSNALDVEFNDGSLDKLLLDLEYGAACETPAAEIEAIQSQIVALSGSPEAAGEASCLNSANAAAIKYWMDAAVSVLYEGFEREELASNLRQQIICTSRLSAYLDKDPTEGRTGDPAAIDPRAVKAKEYSPDDTISLKENARDRTETFPAQSSTG